MSDNVVANPGSGGATFATDDDGTAQHPYVKVEWGADNTQTKVAAGASALPIQDGGNSITVDGTLTAVTTVGTVTNVVHVDDNSGSLTVDGTVTSNAGTNLNTSLLALEAGGNLASIKAKTDNIPAQGQALAAASLPVVLTAAQITTLTPPAAITGFATETTLAAAAASLSVMDDWDESDRAKVNPIVGQAGVAAGAGAVAATVQRVTLASDDPAVATLGAISGAAVVTDANGTLQQYLRGIVKLLITAGTVVLGAGSALIGNVGHGKTIKTVSGSLTADTDVIAAVTSKRIKVIAYSLISVGTNANTVIFKSNGTSGTELWRILMQSSTAIAAGANLAIAAPSFLFATVAGEKLTMDVNQTDAIHYSITYFDDDAT